MIDKNYLDSLKSLNVGPKKVKVKENKEDILMEIHIPKPGELLQEIFVQAAEVTNMPSGRRKDMTILRLACIAEYDAVNLYEKLSDETNDPNIKKVLLDIANEEKAHIGEFEFLLEHVDPEHEKNENEGEDEVMGLTGLDAPPNEED